MNIEDENLVRARRVYFNTPNGRKFLFRVSNEDKIKILKVVKKDWERLIALHFEKESGITSNDVPYGKWKPLTEKYVKFKERKHLLPGILEATTPTLMDRYINSISYNVSDFSISISYPELVSGVRKGDIPLASVHQIGNGKKRRIIKKGFVDIANKRFVTFFSDK